MSKIEHEWKHTKKGLHGTAHLIGAGLFGALGYVEKYREKSQKLEAHAMRDFRYMTEHHHNDHCKHETKELTSADNPPAMMATP